MPGTERVIAFSQLAVKGLMQKRTSAAFEHFFNTTEHFHCQCQGLYLIHQAIVQAIVLMSLTMNSTLQPTNIGCGHETLNVSLTKRRQSHF
jgi:hypothetical protein